MAEVQTTEVDGNCPISVVHGVLHADRSSEREQLLMKQLLQETKHEGP
jgi:hypothetical protein